MAFGAKKNTAKGISPISVAVARQDTKTAILQYVEDISELTGASKSSIWIQRILYGALSEDSFEAMIKRDVLADAASYGYGIWSGVGGIKGALMSLFNQYQDENGRENDRYWLTLIEYLIRVARSQGLLIISAVEEGKGDPRYNMERDLTSVLDYLSNCHIQAPEQVTKLLQEETRDPLPLLEFLRDNWSLFTPYGSIWTLMFYLVSSLEDWGDDAKSRSEFFEALEQAFFCRRDWEAEIEFKRKNGYFRSKYRSCRMANKEILLYPRTWTLLNPEEAIDRPYAISIYLGEREPMLGAPQAIYFSCDDLRDIDPEELDEAVFMAREAMGVQLSYAYGLEPFVKKIYQSYIPSDARDVFFLWDREEMSH